MPISESIKMLSHVVCIPGLVFNARKIILDTIVAQKIVKFIANDLIDESELQRKTFVPKHSSFKISHLH
jgi:hypothetical protein